MFLNPLTLTLTAKRRLATSEDLNMEKKTRMITPIFLKYNLRPTQIRIQTPMIFTIIPMYSLPLKESTCQEKRSLRKTRCDPRHRTASGKEWALQPVIDQSRISNKLIQVFDHLTGLEFSPQTRLAESTWTKWSAPRSHLSMMLVSITTRSSGEFISRMKTLSVMLTKQHSRTTKWVERFSISKTTMRTL